MTLEFLLRWQLSAWTRRRQAQGRKQKVSESGLKIAQRCGLARCLMTGWTKSNREGRQSGASGSTWLQNRVLHSYQLGSSLALLLLLALGRLYLYSSSGNAGRHDSPGTRIPGWPPPGCKTSLSIIGPEVQNNHKRSENTVCHQQTKQWSVRLMAGQEAWSLCQRTAPMAL